MKQCPTCHFTFADFHHVCAFDGTELVPYEKPQSLMKVSQPAPPEQRNLKPSMSLTSLAVLAVFLSAVLIGYLKSPDPSIPAVVSQERQGHPESNTAPASKIEEEFTAESKPAARATRVRSNPKRRVSTARVQPEVNRAGNRSPTTTVARQTEVPQASREKSPKVVAILKTTWKFLKKPF